MPAREKRRAKGDILLAVLARIAEGAGDATALFGAFVEAGYGASYGRVGYVARRNRAEVGRIERALQSERETTHKYRILLSALKRDGLIEERPNKLGRAFIITRRGIEKLAALRKRKKNMLPSIAYEPEKSDVVTIVTFDIPERERRKRAWLRAVLKRLEFTLVQKSVWMGKIKIPRSLLDDLRALRLVEFVEIFQVTKTGSLKHVA
ncbi:MAG: CRISPR-associated endonuclease Cas2 [Candidatus Jorgensenbacteria bacterium]|nr:CRISPR-associated endonuclease Cas2 [Candidatus Jorgensenbacteria bacterium]